MTKTDIVSKFIQSPSYFKKGADFLAALFNSDNTTIIEAKQEARKRLENRAASLENKQILASLEDEGFGINEIKSDGKTETITASFTKEASPDDIDKIAKVDNITSFVTNYWLKSHKNNTWTYSIQVKRVAKGIDKEVLESTLRDLVPQIEVRNIAPVNTFSEEVCMIYLADIHAGAQNSELNIHGISYNEEDLAQRLDAVLQKVFSLGKVFQNCVIVNLGDSVDGWDGFTLRKTHHLGSLSNKDQFDIYFRCMTNFYNTLFQSGLAANYKVWNCLDDNHAGVQYSYICNKSVQNVLSAMYPQVSFYQQEKFIDVLEIGNHAYAFTHGKDGFMMKYPMKAILDDKIDIWAMQYFDTKGVKDKWKTLVKGDLHMYNVQYGKFGRYVNIPSIYGTSDYISLNYGLSRPGAALEIINPEVEETWLTPIWL